MIAKSCGSIWDQWLQWIRNYTASVYHPYSYTCSCMVYSFHTSFRSPSPPSSTWFKHIDTRSLVLGMPTHFVFESLKVTPWLRARVGSKLIAPQGTELLFSRAMWATTGCGHISLDESEEFKEKQKIRKNETQVQMMLAWSFTRHPYSWAPQWQPSCHVCQGSRGSLNCRSDVAGHWRTAPRSWWPIVFKVGWMLKGQSYWKRDKMIKTVKNA